MRQGEPGKKVGTAADKHLGRRRSCHPPIAIGCSVLLHGGHHAPSRPPLTPCLASVLSTPVAPRRRVAEALGVTTAYAQRLASGRRGSPVESARHCRFASACLMHEVLCEGDPHELEQSWGTPGTLTKHGARLRPDGHLNPALSRARAIHTVGQVRAQAPNLHPNSQASAAASSRSCNPTCPSARAWLP